MGLNLNAQCNHLIIEEIRNGADEVIGRRCNVCVTVLSGVGKCHGCGKDKAELRYVAGEQRYCDKDCRAAELKTIREPKAVAASK